MVLLAERGDGALAERLLDRSVDGAVLMTTRLTSSLPSQLAARDLPFVFLNRVGGVVDAPSVTADNVGGARAAAELLHRARPQRASLRSSGRRTRARRATARPASAPHSPTPASPSRRGGSSAGTSTTRAVVTASTPSSPPNDPPTAVFCANDFIAVGVLNRAIERGVAVPDDLAVVGFDDLDMAAWPAFGLTTVHNPLREMARRAAAMLVERIADPAPGGHERAIPPSSCCAVLTPTRERDDVGRRHA